MHYEYLSLESAEDLHKSKKAQADNKKLKTDNELYKHLYEIELKRNKELQEKYEEADNDRHRLFEQKEKAIEYIEGWQRFPHTNGSTHEELRNLKSLLQGEDKEC